MLGKNGKCKQPHSFELLSLKWWMTRYVSFFVSHTPYSIHKQSLRIKNIVMQHPTLSRYKIQQRDSYKFRTFLSLISRVLHVVGGAENEWMVSRQKLRIEQGNLPNRDKRVTEIDWNLLYAIHDQSANICIQRYLWILWIGKAKSLKIDNIQKGYVLCFKLEYFFRSCKTEPLNATSGREMSVKNHYMEP